MVQATRCREGRARDMKGPLSPPWIIPRIAHSFSFFLGHCYILFFKRQQSYHCNLPIADKYFLNVLIRISYCHRANYFFRPLALKHFAWKLNVFGQNFSFSPFSSDLWRKVVFTAEHLLNGQSRLHFCNTLTAARTLPHFDKIIKNTCSLQNVFATQSHWPEYFPILRKSSWFVLTRIKTKKERHIWELI